MTTLTQEKLQRTISQAAPETPKTLRDRPVHVPVGLDSGPTFGPMGPDLEDMNQPLETYWLDINLSLDLVFVKDSPGEPPFKPMPLNLKFLRQWIWRLESGNFDQIRKMYNYTTISQRLYACAIGTAYCDTSGYKSLMGIPVSLTQDPEADLARYSGLPRDLTQSIPGLNDYGASFSSIARLLRQFLPDPQEILL